MSTHEMAPRLSCVTLRARGTRVPYKPDRRTSAQIVVSCGIFAFISHLVIIAVVGYEPVSAKDSEVTDDESLGSSDLPPVSRVACKSESAAASGPHNVQSVASNAKSESDVVDQTIHIFLGAKADRILIVNIPVIPVRCGHIASLSVANRLVTM